MRRHKLEHVAFVMNHMKEELAELNFSEAVVLLKCFIIFSKYKFKLIYDPYLLLFSPVLDPPNKLSNSPRIPPPPGRALFVCGEDRTSVSKYKN